MFSVRRMPRIAARLPSTDKEKAADTRYRRPLSFNRHREQSTARIKQKLAGNALPTSFQEHIVCLTICNYSALRTAIRNLRNSRFFELARPDALPKSSNIDWRRPLEISSCTPALLVVLLQMLLMFVPV